MKESQGWSDEHKRLVKATVGKDLSAASLAQLEHISVSRGLDPLNNELYAINKGGRATFITSINGMLKVAANQLDGVETLFYDESGASTPVWLPKQPPAACGVTVYRKGCARGFTATVRFDDYKAGNLWQKMPSTMIRKVALASALRLCFSDLLAGLYASEEMDQAQPEVQTQQAPPKTGKAAKSPATQGKAPAVAAAKESDAVAADAAAQNLAKSLGGEVVEGAEDQTPVLKDLQSVGAELGFTEFAIAEIAKIVKGDFAKGISTMQAKTPAEVEKLNAKFAPVESEQENW